MRSSVLSRWMTAVSVESCVPRASPPFGGMYVSMSQASTLPAAREIRDLCQALLQLDEGRFHASATLSVTCRRKPVKRREHRRVRSYTR